MYLLIPLGIFIISVLIIAYILVSKFVYLRKLSPDVLKKTTSKEGFWAALFPGVTQQVRPQKIQGYRVRILYFWSAFLSRIRNFWKAMDNWIQTQLISVHKKHTYHKEVLSEHKEESERIIAQKEFIEPKALEQELIIKIAKSPKDTTLYKELGALYVSAHSWNDARDAYEKAVDLSPNDTEAQKDLDKVKKHITIE